MRPIKLIIEGFTSFRSRQELDFSNLDLFAITGDTGAGKSSLLDAITYALYGKVARLSGQDQGKYLLSQGSQDLKVELNFSVQNTEYKIIRKWEKRTKTPKKQFLLDKLNNGKWERITDRIESILKMDFDTFTRVIFLPQGQFDQFLKGEPPERRKMLRSLAGLEIFEQMRSKASEKAKELDKELEKIKGKLEGINAPSEAELKDKQGELDKLNLKLPQLQQEKDNAQKLLDDETRLFEQIKTLSQLQNEWDKLINQEENITKLSQQLELIKKAVILLGDWQLKEDLLTRLTQAENEFETKTLAFNKAHSEFNQQQEKYQEFKSKETDNQQQFEQRKQDLTTAKVYLEQSETKQQELHRLQVNCQQKEQQYANVNKELKSVENNINTTKQELEKCEQILLQNQAGGSRLEKLTQVINSLLPEWKNFNQQTEERLKKLENIGINKQKIEQQKTETLNKIKEQETKLNLAEKALEEAKQNNSKIEQNNHAQALKASLNHGDECPVCGGFFDQNNLLSNVIDIQKIDLKPLETEVKQENKKYQELTSEKIKLETELNSLLTQEDELQKELGQYQQELKESQKNISTILNEENWNIQTIKLEYQNLKNDDEKYKEAVGEKDKNIRELEKLEQRSEFAKKTVVNAGLDLDSAKSSQQSCQEEYQELLTKLAELTQGKSCDNLEKQLNNDRQQWEKEKLRLEKNYQKLQGQMIKSEADYNNSKNNRDNLLADQDKLEKQWQNKLKEVELTESDFQVVKTQINFQQKWEQEIKYYNDNKLSLQSRMQQIRENIGPRNIDQESLQVLEQIKQEKEKIFGEAKKEQTTLENWLKAANDKQQEAQELLTEKNNLNQQVDTYKELAGKLHSDEFQAYILEHLEKELVETANILLKDLTESRYALIIENKEYQVEDNWNGGERRSIKTLSGGETFGISLSMALALSEKLSMGVELGSLFIDEGFGTLDQGHLENVSQILESLKQKERLIGIITHIPALAERLPNQIKVHKSPSGSSFKIENY
jgi:DNA repair protein SbcC/Rad50